MSWRNSWGKAVATGGGWYNLPAKAGAPTQSPVQQQRQLESAQWQQDMVQQMLQQQQQYTKQLQQDMVAHGKGKGGYCAKGSGKDGKAGERLNVGGWDQRQGKGTLKGEPGSKGKGKTAQPKGGKHGKGKGSASNGKGRGKHDPNTWWCPNPGCKQAHQGRSVRNGCQDEECYE